MSDDDWKEYHVFLDRRGQETVEHARVAYGATVSGALRAGLLLLRKQFGLDPPIESD